MAALCFPGLACVDTLCTRRGRAVPGANRLARTTCGHVVARPGPGTRLSRRDESAEASPWESLLMVSSLAVQLVSRCFVCDPLRGARWYGPCDCSKSKEMSCTNMESRCSVSYI